VLNTPNDPWLAALQLWPAIQVRFNEESLGASVVYSYFKLSEPGYGPLGVIRGSQGYLELAMHRESAARCLGCRIGDMITLAALPPQAS